MKTYARYIFAVLFVGLVFTTFSAVANAQSLTGDSPIGGGINFGGGDGSGGAWNTNGGGGYSYDPNDAPIGSGGPLVSVPNNGQYSTPSDKPTGYCANAPAAPFKNVTEVLKYLTCLILQSVIPLLFAVALAVFVWGTVKFIQASDSAEKEQGRQFMLWGVIALAVMLSVWSLTAVLNNTFGLRTVIPQLPVNKEVQ